MSKFLNNINTIRQNDLLYMHNKQLRIMEREEKIKNLESLYKTPLLAFSNYSNFRINHNSNKKKINNKKSNLNLPRINTIPNKTLSSFERMKNYKVIFHKKNNNVSENRVKKFLTQSGFSLDVGDKNKKKLTSKKIIKLKEDKKEENIDKNIETRKSQKNIERIKSKTSTEIKTNKIDELKNDIKHKFIDDKSNTNKSNNDVNDKNNKKKYKNINFEDYIKMQNKAEIALKPKFGDESKDLIEYIKAIQGIRQNIVENLVNEINNAENRYNNEKPEEDSEFNIKDKSLYVHKWKNLFFLRDYQKYFLKGLKGKISNNNYYLMQQKFLEINSICFAEPKGQPIKNIEIIKNQDEQIKNIDNY